jgi:predicted DNA-binding transcriptional regulator AlpA
MAKKQPKRLTAEEIAELCGVSPRTVWRWSRFGCFGESGKKGLRVTVWNETAVRRFIDAGMDVAAFKKRL